MSVVGVAAFSGTALAHGCPRTPGYWANHDWCEVPVSTDPSLGSVAESLGLDCDNIESDTYSLAGVSMTMEEWQEFLVAPVRGDKSHIMAKHVLATQLNFQRRSSTDPGCVDAEIFVEGLGTTTVREVLSMATDWLWASNWGTDLDQRDWVVDGVDGEVLKDVLDDFNNARLGLDCDCPAEENGGGNGNGPPQGAGQSGNGNGKGGGPP